MAHEVPRLAAGFSNRSDDCIITCSLLSPQFEQRRRCMAYSNDSPAIIAVVVVVVRIDVLPVVD
jgi:hypothetical protein